MKSWKWPLRFLGLAAMAVVLLTSDVSKVLILLSKIEWKLFLAGFLLLIPTLTLQSWRWGMLLKIHGIDAPPWKTFRIYTASVFAGTILPGIGDFSRVFYMRDEKTPAAKTIMPIALERIIDIGVIFMAGFVSLILIFRNVGFYAVLFLLVILSAAAAVFLLSGFMRGSFENAAKLVVPERFQRVLAEFKEQAGSISRGKTIEAAPFLILSTAAIMLLHYLRFYALARAIGIELSMYEISLCSSVAWAIMSLPITVLGVGTRDVSYIGTFAVYGVSSETAVAYSTVILASNLLKLAACSAFWTGRPPELNVGVEEKSRPAGKI